ncbi:MAG TPA: MltA domain-containing protein, partial [Xanthobacteraceae bacterium]|nr:MltA domain-containing protein [Xanthobacteraceae bacterium]
MVAGLFGAIMCLAAGGAAAEGPLKLAGSQLEPVKWSELAGWTADDHLAAFAAYQASCQALRKLKSPRGDDRGQISAALSNVCRNAMELRPKDADTARAFFERNFQPVRISRLGEAEGLLTGYFEPVVAGSRFPSPEFPVPLYRRPKDLLAAGYKPASVAFPNKGVRIARRNESNELVPYHDRAAIEAGALDGQKLEICWLKSPLDLLVIQIEGSARVILEDGTPLRVSYDSHNGYRYSSIERVLMERHLIPREEMSPQRIRDWMAAHPDEAAKVRATNRSYVFFRVTGLSNEGEPVGAQGVPLTPGRSIAVDRLHEYGTPFFIEASLPIDSVKSVSPFGRLMIAQDTGSAIVGPARADLYWGAGDAAGRVAGRIRHRGRFAMLLPRELDMTAAATQMPLPAPKPKIPEGEDKNQEAKGKADLAAAGAIGAAKKPSPNLKIAATEVTKQSGKAPAPSTKAGEMAAGKKPSPNLKIVATEVAKHSGKATALSTKAGEMAAGSKMPLAKLKTAANEVSKQDSKDKARSAKAGEIVAGRQMPLAKLKTAAIEASKPEGQGKTRSAKAADTVPAKQVRVVKTTTAIEIIKQRGKGKAESTSSDDSTDGRKVPSSKPKAPPVEVKKQDGQRKAKSAPAGEDGKAAARLGAGKPPPRERAT